MKLNPLTSLFWKEIAKVDCDPLPMQLSMQLLTSYFAIQEGWPFGLTSKVNSDHKASGFKL